MPPYIRRRVLAPSRVANATSAVRVTFVTRATPLAGGGFRSEFDIRAGVMRAQLALAAPVLSVAAASFLRTISTSAGLPPNSVYQAIVSDPNPVAPSITFENSANNTAIIIGAVVGGAVGSAIIVAIIVALTFCKRVSYYCVRNLSPSSHNTCFST